MTKTWPMLSYPKGKDTYETLHLFTQVLGKIKLATLPWANHSWNVTLHIIPTGLTTLSMPYQGMNFQIDLDLISHKFKAINSHGVARQFEIQHLSVAAFYKMAFEALTEMGISLEIFSTPSEIMNPVPFELDIVPRGYDPLQAVQLHQALLSIQNCFMVFRGAFTGKSSPIHFFWGGFDLSLALFSGSKAPTHPGKIPGLPNWVLQDAFSHEVSDFGFIAGSEAFPEPAFYCYLYPEPDGYQSGNVQPQGAWYNKEMGQFLLPYSTVAESGNPEQTLLEFLRSSYATGAELAGWNVELFKDNKVDSRLQLPT